MNGSTNTVPGPEPSRIPLPAWEEGSEESLSNRPVNEHYWRLWNQTVVSLFFKRSGRWLWKWSRSYWAFIKLVSGSCVFSLVIWVTESLNRRKSWVNWKQTGSHLRPGTMNWRWNQTDVDRLWPTSSVLYWTYQNHILNILHYDKDKAGTGQVALVGFIEEALEW